LAGLTPDHSGTNIADQFEEEYGVTPQESKTMRIASDYRPIVHIDGVVGRVDPVSREVEVHAGGTTVSIDVRPDCIITLRGERVKLRLIQPRDRVRVAYAEYQGARVANALEVQPGTALL
jgi:hypothetical protein